MSEIEWETGVPETRWTVGFENLTFSHLSTMYALIPLSAKKAGVPYNPTSDALQFAFMPNSVQQPVNADWVNGVWESVPTNIIYPYNAKCLVGPNGTTVLTLGTYIMYMKITDSPETPVLVAGQLTIS